MEEQAPLKALGVLGEWIWGDDAETTVYAQAYGQGKTLIFRFTRENDETVPSLPTQFVNCFHDLPVDSGQTPICSTRSAMRVALWEAVAAIWVECGNQAGVEDADVVIDVFGESVSGLSYKICHDERYNDYLRLLAPLDQVAVKQPVQTVEFDSLTRLHQLGGRGCTTLVVGRADPGKQVVFKGIDFRTYLYTYEDGHVQDEVKTFYHSMHLLRDMPPHPNIMAPSQTLVTISKPGDNISRVCGNLYPYFSKGNLGGVIAESNKAGERILLSNKARWCYQMTAALAHTHLVAHTYHMDIKPGNFLLDDNDNLVLIDWEQSGVPITTAAPEIDGTWDVEEIAGKGDSKTTLKYTKYTGPQRRNMPESTPGNGGWSVWNVYPVWNRDCPKALQLAEVFSLGRTMWMLLRQPDMDVFEDVESTDDVVEDWESTDDIPSAWKHAVQACLERDPNRRMDLRELLDFWEAEVEKQCT